MLYRVANTVEFYKNGVGYCQFAVPLGEYIDILFYWDGVNVTGYLNGVQKNQVALVGPLISAGTLVLGKINDLLEFAANIGTFELYTGLDVQKIIDVRAKISAPYLALNP